MINAGIFFELAITSQRKTILEKIPLPTPTHKERN